MCGVDDNGDELIFAILSSCFDHNVVTHLVISGQALPVPPEMGAPIDLMECWGKMISGNWHVLVMNKLSSLLKDGIELSDEGLVFECIKRRVIRSVDEQHLPSHAREFILHQWRSEFDEMYHSCGKQFVMTCGASFQYMWTIAN